VGDAVNEETLVKTMELPDGRDWEWYGDLNVVVLAPHLCPARREVALNEVQAHWRRSCIRILPADDYEHEVGETQPLAYLPSASG
jgi:hypothetical protein